MAKDRFLADCMLGSLARWLILMGQDVKYIARIGDDGIVRIALEEDRIVLTRDRELAHRRKLRSRAFFIPCQELEDQIRLVSERFLIPIARSADSPRCSLCNAQVDPVEKESVRGLVPPYTFQTQERFGRCRACGKVYWPGSHVEHMDRTLESIRDNHENS